MKRIVVFLLLFASVALSQPWGMGNKSFFTAEDDTARLKDKYNVLDIGARLFLAGTIRATYANIDTAYIVLDTTAVSQPDSIYGADGGLVMDTDGNLAVANWFTADSIDIDAGVLRVCTTRDSVYIGGWLVVLHSIDADSMNADHLVVNADATIDSVNVDHIVANVFIDADSVDSDHLMVNADATIDSVNVDHAIVNAQVDADSVNADHLVVNTNVSLPAGSLEASDIALTQNNILVGNVSNQAAAGRDLPRATTIGLAYVYRAGGTDVADADVVDALTISGGTVNNSPIGASVASTGAFTTLKADSLNINS
ncbi:MAG: hypothetical protein PHV11_06335, partial [Candidatus Bipolaricaulis sp.]|nr:hypothetical protein [Candidatus Bipolaricaulis sp.]